LEEVNLVVKDTERCLH